MSDDLNEFHQEKGEDMVKESSKNVDVTAATKISELDVNQHLKGAYIVCLIKFWAKNKSFSIYHKISSCIFLQIKKTIAK